MSGKSYFSLNFGDATSIRDDSNNELLTFDVNGSAANNLQITNNAAGSNVSIEVIGSDTDIGLNLNPKGHGKVNILGSTSNAGGIRFYGNGATDDSTYVGLTANTDVTSDISFVLPSSDGTSGQVLQTDGIGNLSFTNSSSGGVGDASDTELLFNNNGTVDGIQHFTTNDAGTQLTISSSSELRFGTANEKISGDGNDLTVASGRHITLDAATDINLDPVGAVVVTSGKAIEFGGADSGETIIGDGDDLTVASGRDIKLDPTGAVVVTSGKAIEFGGADSGETITGDGADLYVNSSNSINLAPSANVTITSGKNLEFGVGSGETISGNGTDLTIASGNDINLNSTGAVVIPDTIQLEFGSDTENIVSGSNSLTISAGADINLTATTNVNIPPNKGLTFGDDGENISGDGTDLTVASSNILNLTPGSTSNVVITQGSLVLSTSSAITSASTTIGSPTILAPVECISLYNLSGAGTAHYVSVDGQPSTNGQLWNVLFDVSAGTPSLRIDFGSDGLATGSGDAQYLTFNTGGQSASLIYHTSKWRIINTGAAVS